MIEIPIELTGEGMAAVEAVKDLLQTEELKPNQSTTIAEGASLTYVVPPGETVQDRHGLTYDEAFALHAVISLAEVTVGGVATSIVGNYIYDKLKSKKERVKLKIKRRVTEVERDKITRTIEEEIEVKRD